MRIHMDNWRIHMYNSGTTEQPGTASHIARFPGTVSRASAPRSGPDTASGTGYCIWSRRCKSRCSVRNRVLHLLRPRHKMLRLLPSCLLLPSHWMDRGEESREQHWQIPLGLAVLLLLLLSPSGQLSLWQLELQEDQPNLHATT